MSIENNADTLTYQQLKNKYRQLYLENEKMCEYLSVLLMINHKWKKGSAEVECHSKINVLGKLSERLSSLINK